MIKKKVCLLGAYAVGKTSLVQRFVKSIFSEKYFSTIGVKIDQKILTLGDFQLNLVLWDIHGEDDYQQIKPQYLSGAAACLFVIDGTRRNTIEIAKKLKGLMDEHAGNLHFIGLVNKSDLVDEWEVTSDDIKKLEEEGWPIILTSAKTGDDVEHAFKELGRMILEQK